MPPVSAALARVYESPEEPDPQQQGGMSFLEHLEELRVRIIRSLMAIAAGMAIAFYFIDDIVQFLLEPTLRTLPPGAMLIYTQPGEGFSFWFNIALIAGTILASPFVFLQVWLFIAPALHAREKKFVIPFVLLTTSGTLAGAAFSHYVMFPSMMRFFGLFNTPHQLAFMPRVSDVYSLYLRMLMGMVGVFQLPTFAFFLARLGLVTARWLWRNFRYAILIIFIVAAVLTPSPSPTDQIVFAAPMIVLYVLSIGIAWMAAPRRS